jgi:mevalonate kinase
MYFKEISSKVLLFGEYSILFNSKALTIPLDKYCGQLKYSSSYENENNKLIEFYYYLKEIKSPINFEKLKRDLDLGLYFDSSIPIGQGLGSSAALSASIFKAYCEESVMMDLNELKLELGKIESYFHGKSSGLDPLVSFVGEPILVNNDSDLKTINSSIANNNLRVFLVPSVKNRKGKKVIKLVLDKLEAWPVREKFLNEYLSVNDSCVDTFLTKSELLESSIEKLSNLQLEIFEEVISEEILDVWKSGLNSGDYLMKLCGAGGGGHYLAFSFKDSFEAPVSWQELEL